MDDENFDEETAFIFKDFPCLSDQTNESKNTGNSVKSKKITKKSEKNESRPELNPSTSSSTPSSTSSCTSSIDPLIEATQPVPMNVEKNENNRKVKQLFEIELLVKELQSHVGIQTLNHYKENFNNNPLLVVGVIANDLSKNNPRVLIDILNNIRKLDTINEFKSIIEKTLQNRVITPTIRLTKNLVLRETTRALGKNEIGFFSSIKNKTSRLGVAYFKTTTKKLEDIFKEELTSTLATALASCKITERLSENLYVVTVESIRFNRYAHTKNNTIKTIKNAFSESYTLAYSSYAYREGETLCTRPGFTPISASNEIAIIVWKEVAPITKIKSCSIEYKSEN